MKFKISIIVTALALTFANSLYSSMNSVQAIGDSKYINNPEYIAECYNPDTSIGMLEERIELYNYLTSYEYTQSIFEKIVNEDGSVSYNLIDGAEQYIKTNETLENGDIIQYIYYTDSNNNYVRLHNDGTVDLLVGEENNQYYADQVQEYGAILDEINQEYGLDCKLDFSIYTPKEAQNIIDSYKLMTLEEYKTCIVNNI